MLFWVNLIKVTDIKSSLAAINLVANCEHIRGEYWFFEGDEEALKYDEIGYDSLDFEVLGRTAMGTTSGTEEEKMKMVYDHFCLDPWNIFKNKEVEGGV